MFCVDFLLELACAGVLGVNWSGVGLGGWVRWQYRGVGYTSSPSIYGLIMFSQFAPSGAKILNIRPTNSRGWVKTWVSYTDDGTIRVLILNKDLSPTNAGPARITIPGRGAATLQVLYGNNNLTETDNVSALRTFRIGMPSRLYGDYGWVRRSLGAARR